MGNTDHGGEAGAVGGMEVGADPALREVRLIAETDEWGYWVLVEIFPCGDQETGKKPGEMVEPHNFLGWLSMVESVRDGYEKRRGGCGGSVLRVYRDTPS